jgi:hypothetical protein
MDKNDLTYLCVGSNNENVGAIALYGEAGYRPELIQYAKARYVVLNSKDGSKVISGTEEAQISSAGNVVMDRIKDILKKFGISNMYNMPEGLNSLDDLWMLRINEGVISSIESWFV